MTALPVTTYPHIEQDMEDELLKAADRISPAYRLLVAQVYRSFGHSIETLKLNKVPPQEVFELLPGLYVSMTVMFLTAVFNKSSRDDAIGVAESIMEQAMATIPTGFDAMWPTDHHAH